MSLGVGSVLFQMINKFITDIINEYSASYQPDALKFAISALLISTPIYFLTMREIHKNLYSGALAKDSEIRKWLTYFILLVSSVIMIGWFIYVVNSFLGGELTLKIALKALVAILINAGIFSFYLYDIRREKVTGTKDKIIKIYLYMSLIVVVSVFVSSLFVVESPQETRNRKIDERILRNMNSLENAISMYHDEFGVLPDNLNELLEKETFLSKNTLEHPQTKEQLTYNIINETEYELCADFLTSNLDESESGRYYSVREGNLHDKGYQCLSKRVRIKDKDAPVSIKEKVIY
jgi:hypothetical protein